MTTRELLPVDDTPPAELDALGVGHGAHDLDVPRELAPLLSGLFPVAAATPGRGATVERALAFLESQLGLAEYPAGSNNNWITDWYFGWHAAWCAMTVSRALIEAGFGTAEQIDIAPLDTTSRKGWAYCPYIETDFRNAGRWHTADPQPGDLVLFDWDGDEWCDHVGMLKMVSADGTLFVYEGNTDEGVLRLKHRSRTYVRGYARPPYTAVAPTPVPVPVPVPVPMSEEDTMLRYISGGQDYVFPGPGRGDVFATSTDGQLAALDVAGVKAIGQVDDSAHAMFQRLGKGN